MAGIGTVDQLSAQYVEEQTSWGDTIATDNQAIQAEARMFAHNRTLGMPNDVRSFRRFYVQLLIFAANIGTGAKEYWNGKNINYTDHNAAARATPASDIWDRIIGDPNNVGAAAGFAKTVKAYFRARTTHALAIFKGHPDQLKRSTRMGLPKAFEYLACDFLDGAKGLSNEEQGAIDASKQLLLYRSNTTKQLNTANVYTGAQSTSNSGSVQTNARQITFN